MVGESIRKKLCLGLLLFVCAGIYPQKPGFPAGPLWIKNLYPLYLPFSSPAAESAECINPGDIRLRLGYNLANTFRLDYGEEIENFIIDLDLENQCFTLDFTVGIRRWWDLALECSFYIQSAGVLDPWINSFHNLCGFPGSGRESYAVGRNHVIAGPVGEFWINSCEPVRGFQALMLKSRFNLLNLAENRWLLTLRPALKIPLPVGTPLLSNDSWEPSLSLLSDIRWRSLSIYINCGWLHAPPAFSRGPDLFHKNLMRYAFGGEWLITSKFSLNFLLSGMSSPYKVSHRFLGPYCLTISGGGRMQFSKKLLFECGFTEELFFYAASDIHFFSSLNFFL